MPGLIYEIDIGFGVSGPDPEFEWINKPPWPYLGPYRHPLALYQHTGDGSGFPRDMETPVFVVDLSNGASLTDGEPGGGRAFLISKHAKEVFESADPEAFDFRKVVMRIRMNGRETEGSEYYLCDVIRFVDALDEARSDIKIMDKGNRVAHMLSDKNIFRSAAIGNHKVFRLMFTPYTIACTEAFRTSVREAGLTSFGFKPLGELDA